MIGRLRDWLTPETRAADPVGYTAQLIEAAQLAAARGVDGARDTAAYAACQKLDRPLGKYRSTGRRALSEALQPHLASDRPIAHRLAESLPFRLR